MRTYDFTPLYRSTVGFDRIFDMLDSTVRPDWPPYDIERVAEDRYKISMAVAGFSTSEIELTQQGNSLLVTGQKAGADGNQQEFLHRGIANRSFKQTFSLADHVKVTDASLENGMLVIQLVREIPEQLKPRRIAVGTTTASTLAQDNGQKQISQNAKAA